MGSGEAIAQEPGKPPRVVSTAKPGFFRRFGMRSAPPKAGGAKPAAPPPPQQVILSPEARSTLAYTQSRPCD